MRRLLRDGVTKKGPFTREGRVLFCDSEIIARGLFFVNLAKESVSPK